MRTKAVVALSLCLSSWVGARVGHAQESFDRLQIGLLTSLVRYNQVTIEAEAGGVTSEDETRRTGWGLASFNGVGLEIGYGVTDLLVVGGRLELGGESTTEQADTLPEMESSGLDLLLAPKIDVMFSPGEPVRPLLGAAAGLLLARSEEDLDTTQGLGPVAETSVTGLALMARGGLRWFPVPGVTFDPAVAVHWQTGSGETEFAAGTVDVSIKGIGVALEIGVSGWL